MPLRLLLCLILSLIWAAGCQKSAKQAEGKPDSETAKPAGQSALYDQFDPSKFREKYSPKFSRVSNASDFSARASGDIFKSVEIQGDISKEQFQKVFESVQAELFNLAKSSPVTIDGQPNSAIKGRPEWLFKMYFSDAKPDSLHGSHFTYSQGPIQGAVEILTQALGEEYNFGWKMVVVLHEKPQIEAGK